MTEGVVLIGLVGLTPKPAGILIIDSNSKLNLDLGGINAKSARITF